MAARRTRIAEGVYRDKYGLAATVKVGLRQIEERFPVDQSLDVIQAWRARTRADLLEDREDRGADAPIVRGTFAGDLPRRLKQIDGQPRYKSDRSHLMAWLPALGKYVRSAIRPAYVQAAIDGWLKAGKSARTIRHRVRVLRELYKGLDGAHSRPPVKGVTVPKPGKPHPIAVPWRTVQRVAKSLKQGKRHAKGYGGDSDQAYARFLVRATTGQRPAQIMRATKEDIDLRRRLWYVRAAKGGNAIALPLDADMIRAWKVFIAANAWGPFDTRSFSKTIRRHGWPATVRPYALRSTFAIDMIRGGADLGDVQAALGHRQIETTRSHYASIQLARARVALKLKKRGRLE